MSRQPPLDPELAHIVSLLRIRLSARTPFFGSLALFADVVSSETIPTAATDGRQIIVNPQFFKGLATAEQEGVFLHEVLHAALLHVPRGQGRDAKRWNIAADIVVNGILAKEGYTLPDDHLRDHWLERFSVEEVYDLLKQPRQEQRKRQLVNPDLLTDSPDEAEMPAPDGQVGQEQQSGLKEFWDNAREQASIMAESSMYGDLPASLTREYDQLAAEHLNWRHYLWRFLVRTPIDYSGFDRRFVGQGMYLETLEGESVRVAVAVDTSGSINKGQVTLFLNEVQGILQAYPHLRCDLYYADAKLYGPHLLQPTAPIPPPVGGGGTDFRPFFEQLAGDTDPWTTTVAVYLTDGYGRFPENHPTDSVLWVVTPGGKASDQFPFGEVVRLRAES